MPGGDLFADDDVFLQAQQRIDLALDCGFGQHARSLLERRGGQERFGCQCSLRNAQQRTLRLRGDLALLDRLAVRLIEAEDVDERARQQVGVVRFLDLDLAQHLADDNLNVLVRDFYALTAVGGLDFLDDVVLNCLHAQNAQQIVRVDRAFDHLVAGGNVYRRLRRAVWSHS